MSVTRYNKLLLGKVEATKGVDVVPTPLANAIRVKSCKFGHSPDIVMDDVVKQTMGPLPHLMGGKASMGLEIEVQLKPSGVAGTPPEYSPLLQCCGLLETIVAATSVAYDPLTNIDNHKTGSFYWYEDGKLFKLIGAVVKHTFDANIGTIGGFKFTVTAPYLAPTDVTAPTTAVYQNVAPIIMSSADVINDGAAIKVGAFSLDGAEEVVPHYTTNAQNIYEVAGRDPQLKITQDSVSTSAIWTSLMAMTNTALSATFGVSAGNRLVITAPVMRKKGVTIGERANRHTNEVSYGLYESAGDDQFKYLFN